MDRQLREEYHEGLQAEEPDFCVLLPGISPFTGETDEDECRPAFASVRSQSTRAEECEQCERISRHDRYNLSCKADFEHPPRQGTYRAPHHPMPWLAKMDSYSVRGGGGKASKGTSIRSKSIWPSMIGTSRRHANRCGLISKCTVLS